MDIGEASSIALALEEEKPYLIIDEKKGRKIAKALHIDYTGSLGVLLLAKDAQVIEAVKVILDKILQTDFRVNPQTIREILLLSGEE